MERLQSLITTGGEKGKEPWREHQQGSWPPKGPGGCGSGGGGRLGVGWEWRSSSHWSAAQRPEDGLGNPNQGPATKFPLSETKC